MQSKKERDKARKKKRKPNGKNKEARSVGESAMYGRRIPNLLFKKRSPRLNHHNGIRRSAAVRNSMAATSQDSTMSIM